MSGYRKAVVAGLVALFGSLAVAAEGGVSLQELFVALGAAAVGFGGTYQVSNDGA